ncbi:hypothetical protein [Komagataeibacter europaeus]|uniref:hypothetical protein n=1 Tax=Komagataeibacter europaeus TaxID=33995 RepID=UPI00165187B3|nr:hypothetical protein [Komagataeibacter europaeus]
MGTDPEKIWPTGIVHAGQTHLFNELLIISAVQEIIDIGTGLAFQIIPTLAFRAASVAQAVQAVSRGIANHIQTVAAILDLVVHTAAGIFQFLLFGITGVIPTANRVVVQAVHLVVVILPEVLLTVPQAAIRAVARLRRTAQQVPPGGVLAIVAIRRHGTHRSPDSCTGQGQGKKIFMEFHHQNLGSIVFYMNFTKVIDHISVRNMTVHQLHT